MLRLHKRLTPASALALMLSISACSDDVGHGAPDQEGWTIDQDTCTAQRCDEGCDACPSTPAEPRISKAEVIYDRADATGRTLRCQYDYSDLNQAPDQSKVQWLLNDVLQEITSINFDAYSPGDAVSCRVTAHNGTLQGNTITSAPLYTPTPHTIASALHHSCAIQDGRVYCWGNTTAELSAQPPAPQLDQAAEHSHITVPTFSKGLCAVQRGALSCKDLSTDTIKRPEGMALGVSIAEMSSLTTCAIQYGALKCWGRNQYGQLGDGTTTDRQRPTQVIGMERGVSDVSTSDYKTCAVQDGALKCWGYINVTDEHQVITNTTPVIVPSLESGVTQVTTRDRSICAIQHGTLKCWSNFDHNAPNSSDKINVALETGVTWASIKGQHYCAVQHDALKCWGYNGPLIPPWYSASPTPPRQVDDLSQGITEVSTSESHACARQGDEIKCWGDNSVGQLGIPPLPIEPVPTQVVGLNAEVTQLALSNTHSCAIQAGALKCWGDNSIGQLGDGGYLHQNIPTQVLGLTDGVTWVSAYKQRTCAVQDGAVKCWGSSKSPAYTSTPTPIPMLQAGVTQVTVGTDHNCALQDGAVKCWGDDHNVPPQLSGLPIQVPGLTQDVTALSTYGDNSCAIQRDALKCWNHRRLYDQDPTREKVVAASSLNANISQVYMGDGTSCARQGQTIQCWSSLYAPIQPDQKLTPLTFAENATQLSLQSKLACILESGAVKCWDMSGALVSPPAPPTPVDGLQAGVTQLATGERHSCAIQDGAVKCWGNNSHDQLGLGTSNISDIPKKIELPK